MIVIDVGCATYGGDTSIPYLIEEFQPTTLYGFDPAADDADYLEGNTRVIVSTAAAWTYDGEVGFKIAGLGGHVDLNAPVVLPCVDLARFIREIGSSNIALKMDAEGAEYVLLPYLIECGVDKLLDLAWVEWHCDVCKRGGGHRPGCEDTEMETRRGEIEEKMGCEMHRWNR